VQGFLQEGDQGSQQSRIREQFEQSSEKCDEHNFLSIIEIHLKAAIISLICAITANKPSPC
jgi:hypothetical protein